MPPRLLILATVPVTIKSFLLPYALYFRDKGWIVDAGAAGISECDHCRSCFEHIYDIPWTRSPRDLKANLVEARKYVKSLILDQRYDIVHVHTPIAAFIARMATLGLPEEYRPRIVYTAHGFHFYKGGPRLSGKFYLALEKIAGFLTDALVVINDEDRAAALKYGIVTSDKVYLMPGIGVDTSKYRPEQIEDSAIWEIYDNLGIDRECVLFSMVAEYNPGKRHRDLLRALQLLKRQDIHILMAGDGQMLHSTRELALELGVDRQVHLLGYRNDIPALLVASRAMVLPSEREGLPRSILEAMSLGVAVIGADTRGIRDLLQNGAGRIFPVGDHEALARALEELADNPDLAADMGRVGRAEVVKYDISRLLKMHDELYNGLLAGKKHAPRGEEWQ